MKRQLTPIVSLLLVFSLPLAGLAVDGAAVWDKNCKKCHGEDAKGDTAMGKKFEIRDYTDPAVQASFTDEQIVEAINNGITNEAGKKVMLPLGNKLSEEEITAVIAHLRSLKAE